ncbi:MAG TPA: FAD-dependent oxidoreductase [Terriglobales bacterium]|nr:FAD-dependent oxidoreductase [Terriglobales bacterium]
MKSVFVVGAGPAGLFAAQKIALAGHEVAVFNRDIKPGGLAEYGIYPVKDKMKFGLRKQFAKVLSLPNVHYFGHIPVGSGYSMEIEELRQFGPSAMVFAVGAQGTKKLGLPGEEARGVYSAKDFVYHYNLLPPFASQDFSTGKRVAVVGMGNVMVDIARWLLQDDPNRTTEEVIVIARRGPFEAKFDDKEFEHIQMHLDRREFEDELKRVQSSLQAVGQDVSRVTEETFAILKKYPEDGGTQPRLTFKFLCSPNEIHAGPDGRISRLTVTENLLVARNGSTAAKATDRTFDLDVDTMIFAIGDVHDPKLGLPCGPDGYITQVDANDPKRPVYEVLDPERGSLIEGTYVVGWARKASEGLVGIARHDGEVGAAEVLKYLERVPERMHGSSEDIVRYLGQRGIEAVDKEGLSYLARAEQFQAQQRNMAYFKFGDDAEMLRAIEHERSRAVITTAA